MTTEQLKEQIDTVYSQMHTVCDPLRIKVAKLEHEFQDQILVLRNQYYDSVLVDKNGKSIKKNAIVRHDTDNSFYVITDRYNQILFGEVYNNSRVIARKIKANMTLQKTKTEFSYKETHKLEIVSSAEFGIPSDLFTN